MAYKFLCNLEDEDLGGQGKVGKFPAPGVKTATLLAVGFIWKADGRH